MDRLELINAVRREAEGVEQGGFPLRVFPQAMQKIILDWEHNEGYVVEFSAMAMLSAISTALGNALHIRVRSQWTSNASLYCIFVGRPGLGKTPPLDAAFSPIRKKDAEQMRDFCTKLEQYEAVKGKDGGEQQRPRLVRFIVNDFTPEAMFEAHHNNLRGIVILVDEIIGMFNSANRYTSGQLIEQLLSAWSGTPISVIRKSNPKPLYIEHPCINIIGTIQSKLVGQLFNKGYGDNGLLDRMLFVCPKIQKVKPWTSINPGNTSQKPSEQWEKIIEKVFSLEADMDEGQTPKVINFSKDAADCFTGWWNARLSEVNAIEDDNEIDSRVMKRNTNVARLALLFQVARYACGEGHTQFVDRESVESAISLSDYLEECYCRIKAVVASESPATAKEALLKAMQDTFTTQDALAYGQSAGVTNRTVQNWLRSLLEDGIVSQSKKGHYCKQPGKLLGNESEEKQFHISVSSLSSVDEPAEDGGETESERTERSEM